MKSTFYILIGYFICTIRCATTNTTDTAKLKELQEIQELEKQKAEIFKQINEAIEDTIKTLNKSNDTDAKDGITYMTDLQAQIAEFNGTELVVEDDIARNSSENENYFDEINNIISNNISDSFLSGRRKGSKKKKMHAIATDKTGYERIKETILTFGNLKNAAGKMESKKKKARLENAIALQKKLDEWMAQREREKERIRQYKGRQQASRVEVINEDCPDFGESKSKGKKRKSSGMDKYPCCRKCCKKSYMGCLRKK